MIDIVKRKINMTDELRSKIKWACTFNNCVPMIKNGSLKIIEHTNLAYVEPHRVIIKEKLFLFFNNHEYFYIGNLENKYPIARMYLNAITSTTIQGVSIPIVMKNDKEAIQVCLKCCTGINRNSPRIVRISNTLDLEHIWLSEAYLDEVQQMNQIIIKSKLETLNFDANGNLWNNN